MLKKCSENRSEVKATRTRNQPAQQPRQPTNQPANKLKWSDFKGKNVASWREKCRNKTEKMH